MHVTSYRVSKILLAQSYLLSKIFYVRMLQMASTLGGHKYYNASKVNTWRMTPITDQPVFVGKWAHEYEEIKLFLTAKVQN